MFLKFCGLPPPRRSRSIFQMKEPTPFHGSQAKKVVGQWAPCAAHFSPHPPLPPRPGLAQSRSLSQRADLCNDG